MIKADLFYLMWDCKLQIASLNELLISVSGLINPVLTEVQRMEQLHDIKVRKGSVKLQHNNKTVLFGPIFVVFSGSKSNCNHILRLFGLIICTFPQQKPPTPFHKSKDKCFDGKIFLSFSCPVERRLGFGTSQNCNTFFSSFCALC